ncbi:MAG: (Fe-S)-binding protein [Desulfurispora sp.]|uniref:(Fe-S)-binding protein n=1 Tax=Desulfurispora sp. TaxID=3014275 RepID=UPI00404B057C
MVKDHSLALLTEEAHRCMKCGNCQAVCPIYKTVQNEMGVARGKIHLAQLIFNKDQKALNRNMQRLFELCLNCMACSENCPCGVQADQIILAARAFLVRELGLPAGKRFAMQILSHPLYAQLAAGTLCKAQGLFFKKVPGGMKARFPLPVSGLDFRRVLPPLAAVPFLKQAPECLQVSPSRLRVAFFAGCVTNFIYPGVGTAMLELMQSHQIEVVVPPQQHCCGTPLLIHGDRETARQMARSHIDIFSQISDLDAIVTVCGTCGEAFTRYYPELLQDSPAEYENARQLAAKTCDVSQFFSSLAPLDRQKLKPLQLKVTYHSPCHLTRGMRVKEQAIELIKQIPGVEFVPLREAERCCGGAGSFSLTHYELSRQILQQKINNIAASQADAVVTGCGACRMQIADGLAQQNMPVKILHTVELLASALQGNQ